MPSLHFATSVMAAHLLSDTGPVAGAVGWTYALTLGPRARLPGRALRGRPARRGCADRERAARGAAAGAAVRARLARGAAARSSGARVSGAWASRLRRADGSRHRRPADAATARRRGRCRRMRHAARTSRAATAAVRRLRARLPLLRAAADRRPRATPGTASSTATRGGWPLGVVLEVLLVRRLHRRSSGRCSSAASRGSTGARATRSRWPGWPPRGCSPPPARAASR